MLEYKLVAEFCNYEFLRKNKKRVTTVENTLPSIKNIEKRLKENLE